MQFLVVLKRDVQLSCTSSPSTFVIILCALLYCFVRRLDADLPQMVSIYHPNAAMYFARDVQCVKRLFERKFLVDVTAVPKCVQQTYLRRKSSNKILNKPYLAVFVS